MSIAISPPSIFVDEIANFLASQPSREELLVYRPSESAERRLGDLLLRQRESSLSRDESLELAQFQQAEILMRLIKARLRAARPQI